MKRCSVLLLFLLLVVQTTTARTVPLYGFNKPNQLVVDGDQFFIADFPHVYIYSLEHFLMQKKFGREGKRAREFFGGVIFLNIQPDQIVALSGWKTIFYNRQGEFLKELRKDAVFPLGKNFIKVDPVREEKEKVNYWTINLNDAGLKKIKEIYRYPVFMQGKGPQAGAHVINLLRQFGLFKTALDKFVLMDYKDFILHVYDSKGNKLTAIKRKYEKLKITEHDKKKYSDFFKNSEIYKEFYEKNKHRFKFDTHFPAIKGFDFRGGLIYVYTYKEKGAGTELFVFNVKGKLLKKTFLPMKHKNLLDPGPCSFCDWKFYRLIEKDKAGKEWQLNIIDIK
ncbi:MAG: hypothetical protein KAW12_25630 [Candidatus Aminicenantes bacterium]|nr:hypothetical protein [Candidatus Aminicenantes bacterium]